MYREDRIIIDPDLLMEMYLPSDVTGREAQIEELKACLEPAVRKQKPVHAWLYGRPGSGKTSTAKFILRQFESRTPVQGIYINCWEHATLHSVVDKIVRELRLLRTDQQNTSVKLERFERHIADQPFIIVLDEIDQPASKERNAIIYNLCRLEKVGLVCICNSRSFLYELDERIKSRLNPKQIEFRLYTVNDLSSILEQRAKVGLLPGSWNRDKLERIAKLAEGDARVAIQTLKRAADYAQLKGVREISDEHIEKGWNDSKHIKKTYLLDKLTEHHRLFYSIIKENNGIQSGELWDSYLEVCRRNNIGPVALRTYSLYVNKLKDLGLIRADRALVRGKVRVFGVFE
jgi:archaeal cell division control protein 6